MVIFTMDSPPPLSSRTQCSTLLVGRSPGANCTRGSNLGPGRPALGTWLYPSGPQPFTVEVRWKRYQPACRQPLPLLCSGRHRACPSASDSVQPAGGGTGWGQGRRPPGTSLPLRPAPFSSPQLQLAWCSLPWLRPDLDPRPLPPASCSTASSLCPSGPGVTAASFLFLKKLYWSIVSLHCCVSLCCTESESAIRVHIATLSGFPSRLGHHRALSIQ